MARKKVVALDADKTIEWDKVGTKIEGYYVGFKEVQSKFGASKLHIFQQDANSVGCWGSTMLDQKLEGVERGCYTWVAFTGTKPTKFRPMKVFDVEYDDETRLDLSALEAEQKQMIMEGEEGDGAEYPATDESGAETADVDQDEPDYDDEQEVVQAPPPAAARKGAPPANIDAAKARAQALLKSRPRT